MLKKYDSCVIEANEEREIINRTNQVCSILVAGHPAEEVTTHSSLFGRTQAGQSRLAQISAAECQAFSAGAGHVRFRGEILGRIVFLFPRAERVLAFTREPSGFGGSTATASISNIAPGRAS